MFVCEPNPNTSFSVNNCSVWNFNWKWIWPHCVLLHILHISEFLTCLSISTIVVPILQKCFTQRDLSWVPLNNASDIFLSEKKKKCKSINISIKRRELSIASVSPKILSIFLLVAMTATRPNNTTYRKFYFNEFVQKIWFVTIWT